MDTKDRYLDVLSFYESSRSSSKISLLDCCFYFEVDYHKFLGWYGHYKRHLPASGTSPAVHLAPVHISGSPCGSSQRTSAKSVEAAPSDVVSFQLKLGNGIEIRKRKTSLESILSLLEKLTGIC